MKNLVIFILVLVLVGCGPLAAPATAVVLTETVAAPATEVMCAYMEGRQALAEVSGQLADRLKAAGLPVESARAEAYGENCVAEDGSFVRFAARETDFYVTLNVKDLTDEAAMGGMLAQALTVIEQFPVEQTPGPKPGYVWVAFKNGENSQNLWFLREKYREFMAQGLTGAKLYLAVKSSNQ